MSTWAPILPSRRCPKCGAAEGDFHDEMLHMYPDPPWALLSERVFHEEPINSWEEDRLHYLLLRDQGFIAPLDPINPSPEQMLHLSQILATPPGRPLPARPGRCGFRSQLLP